MSGHQVSLMWFLAWPQSPPMVVEALEPTQTPPSRRITAESASGRLAPDPQWSHLVQHPFPNEIPRNVSVITDKLSTHKRSSTTSASPFA